MAKVKIVKATLITVDNKGVTTKTKLEFGKTKGGKPTIAPGKENSTVFSYGKLYLKS